MKKVVGFGDYLIHFSPMGYQRFVQASLMNMSFTGAEANVCAALAYMGAKTEFVTALPVHDLAKHGVAFIRGLGVNTDHIHYGGKRMGVYFLESGASLRSSGVIYDREDSAFCESKTEDYDWEKILEDCGYFYTTGITCALSASLRQCCREALKLAKEKGIVTILDLNYRSKLGTTEDFRGIIEEMAEHLDCLIINEEHSKMLFGISNDYSEEESYHRVQDYAMQVKKLTGIEKIAMPVRRTLSASDARIYAGLLNGESFALSDTYDIHVVDRVGSGDAFSSGIIYSLLHDFDTQYAVNWAAASGALKHTIESDINFSSVEEIRALLEKRSGDVKR